MEFELFLLICNYIGTIAFAVAGAIKGIKKHLDIFGITLLSVVTAVGGGMIRDVLIGDLPAALTEPAALYLSVAVGILLYLIASRMKTDRPRNPQVTQFLAKTNLVFDAIGLAIFALIGASAGVDLNVNVLTSGILATLTGVGGGIIRDLLVNETPVVLKEDVYAVLALAEGMLYHLLVVNCGLPRIPTYLLIFTVALIIRLLVIKYNIQLPNMEKKKHV